MVNMQKLGKAVISIQFNCNDHDEIIRQEKHGAGKNLLS